MGPGHRSWYASDEVRSAFKEAFRNAPDLSMEIAAEEIAKALSKLGFDMHNPEHRTALRELAEATGELSTVDRTYFIEGQLRDHSFTGRARRLLSEDTPP